MADTKISALTELTTPASVDLFAIVDDPGGTPISKKITFANVEAALSITESQISDLGTYLTDIVSDTTPQLGGNLDVNGNKIVSVSNGNIDIEPNGTGNVLLGNFVFDADQTVGAGQDNYVLTYDNATGLISLEAAAGGGGGGAFTADGNSLISPTTSPTLNQATGNEVAFTLDYTVNKATSGNDTGLLVSMTDTASPGTSYPLDVQVGGFSILTLNASGTLEITDNATRGLQYNAAAGTLSVAYGGLTSFYAGRTFKGASLTGVWVASNSMFGFGDATTLTSGNIDVRIQRDAANTLALRNSTNAQTFNIYNTYTDASNYERAAFAWDTNELDIRLEAAGTGTARTQINFDIGGHGNNAIEFLTSSSALADIKMYRPGTGDIGGWIQATNGSIKIAGGTDSSSINSNATLELAGGSNRAILDPYRATAGEKVLGLGYNGTTTGIIAVIQGDVNINRSRAGYELILRGGNAYDSGATNRNGGDVSIEGGVPANSGSRGAINIGTAATDTIGFYGATPVAQQSTTGTTTGFTAGAGTSANDDSTYTGGSGTAAYTVGDIVLALKNVGILAAS